MAQASTLPLTATPEMFVTETSSELSPETLQRRAKAVNSILQVAMLAGLQMEPCATLETFADFIGEIVPHDRMLVFFWDEERETVKLRLSRGVEQIQPHIYNDGNTFNTWASLYGKSMIVPAGSYEPADALLTAMQSNSAIVLPIVISNRVMGSVQLFSQNGTAHFSDEDARLLWIFLLVAENQLNREFAHEDLLRFAFTDYLTGLRTRGYFEQQLDLEIKRAERKDTPLSLLMVDIDHFKQLNDHCGHHVGDQVLRELASVLQKEMRDLDTVARYGGEEFVVILPETDAEAAIGVAQRLRQSVKQANMYVGPCNVAQRITISIGMAVFGRDARFKRDLIEFADTALYRAKHQGRNQVVTYSKL
jgi:diguanylate cyclase (GGDEF)-like protein